MLVLSRETQESIVIIYDGKVVAEVFSLGSGRTRLGIQADNDVTIHRREVYDAIQSRVESGQA